MDNTPGLGEAMQHSGHKEGIAQLRASLGRLGDHVDKISQRVAALEKTEEKTTLLGASKPVYSRLLMARVKRAITTARLEAPSRTLVVVMRDTFYKNLHAENKTVDGLGAPIARIEDVRVAVLTETVQYRAAPDFLVMADLNT